MGEYFYIIFFERRVYVYLDGFGEIDLTTFTVFLYMYSNVSECMFTKQ